MIVGSSLYSEENVWRVMQGLLWIGVLFVMISMGRVIYFSADTSHGLELPVAGFQLAAPPLCYEKIGTGSLSLEWGNSAEHIPPLAGEIQVLARNTRPDLKPGEGLLLLKLKSSGEELEVRNNELFYLESQPREMGLSPLFHFEPGGAPLVLKPLILDRGAVVIEVNMHCAERVEKAQFVLRTEEGGQHPARSEHMALKRLLEAKCWGRDALIRDYGGDQYRAMCDKQKVELSDGVGSYVCFVEAGDYLGWDEGHWNLVPLTGLRRDQPVAYVKAAAAREIEIEAWDEKGFFPITIKLPLQQSVRTQDKAASLPSGVRQRNASQVTCLLGRRRILLKEGDWLLKTAKGWRKLHRWEEIEDCLYHRLRGELFIFDRLEKERENMVLKGHSFDEMRMQSEMVVIPIVGDKPHARKKKK